MLIQSFKQEQIYMRVGYIIAWLHLQPLHFWSILWSQGV